MSNRFAKIEESKKRLRRRLAELPFARKLEILDELREEQIIRFPEKSPPSKGALRKEGRDPELTA